MNPLQDREFLHSISRVTDRFSSMIRDFSRIIEDANRIKRDAQAVQEDVIKLQTAVDSLLNDLLKKEDKS